MKQLFLFLLFPVFSFAQSKTPTTAAAKESIAEKAIAKPADGFVLNGHVQGLANGEVKITALQGDQVIAKGESKNGVFSLTGKLDEPGLYWLTLGAEQPQYLFLENAAVKITGRQSDIKNLQIEGSQSHNDFLQFRKTFDPLFANLNAVALEMQKASEDKKTALMQQYTAAVATMNKAIGDFVAAKPTSYVSVFLLSVTRQINENIADLTDRFNKLSPVVKSSAMGKDLEKYIADAAIGAVGSQAIEFTQNDVNDKPVSLSSFKGKYVLLDFWASWCKPCRMENPNVVKVYNKFKDKNFTVLSVSLDQQKSPWLAAIEKDGLAWTHVSDLQFWNNAAAALYHVQSIPQNYLIDPSGKIVAKDLRGEDLEKKLCQFLGCN